jgi:hypothetical protein
MSGGYFEYQQEDFDNIAEDIHQIIDAGDHPKGMVGAFVVGEYLCRMAAAYVQRIDWLMSGDDDAETFARRLREDADAVDQLITLRYDSCRTRR